MQINISKFIEQSLSVEQRIGAELLKSLGLDGYQMDGLSLLDIFGAPGNSALGSSAGRDIEQIRGWNHTAILAKSLQFALGNIGVFCPLATAEAISFHHGEEYSAANRFTGMEQYGVPENWVQSPMQHRIAKLMKKPNPWCDGAQMLFQMSQQVEAHGVCHFLVLPNEGGQPTQLWIIPRANIWQLSPSTQFPEGSYRVGNLSRVSIGSRMDREPESHQEALARLSNREYSAKWVIPVGLPSIVYCDDFLNPSAAIADVLDTDTQIHQSRRKTLSKQMTAGPRLEPLPGVEFQASERDKLLETFEAENQGPDNQGRAWMTPKGIKVVDDGHSAREMEYTNSTNQSRDHILGQRLFSQKLIGQGEGGAYAEIIGLIKSTNRNVLQPLMRILSGQLTIGLQRYFDEPQSEFMVLIQAGSIDDPEQKMREWGFLKDAGVITKGQVLKAFNMPPFGDERDDEIVGAEAAQPGAANPLDPANLANLGLKPNNVPATGANNGDVGPDKPGVGAAVPPETQQTEKATQNVFGGLTRQQFVRNKKAVLETLQQFESKQIRERTAIATLKTLGLSSEQAQEFVDSVKDEEPAALPVAAPAAQAPSQPVADALFSRMAPTAIDVAANAAQTNKEVGNWRYPTLEELKTGTYKKGRFRIAGLSIAIENPARSERSGVDESGRAWSVEMNSHYGFIIGSSGFDKDQVDVYFPEYTEPTFDGMVYVINQANADGTFDEHKVVIGCNSKNAAKGEYLSNYEDGWKSRIMSIVPFTMDQFKRWLFDPIEGPSAGELTADVALQFGSRCTDTPAAMSTKAVNYDDRLKKLHARRGEDSQGIAKTRDAQEEERAKLIADIVVGAFGDDAERMLSDDDDFGMLVKMFGKVWDESKYRRHPRGARMGGRFAPKNSSEAVTAVHGAIEDALKGSRSEESASELVDLLSNLTLNELRAVKEKYQMSASGRTKKDLVAKIAARLDSGRRVDQSPEPASQQSQPQPEKAPQPVPNIEHERRLMDLREKLPAGMLIMEDDDGNEMLVNGSNQYLLPPMISEQLNVLESKLRELGHDPDAILNGAAQPERETPEPSVHQNEALARTRHDDAYIVTQPVGAGLIVARTQSGWITVEQGGQVQPAQWTPSQIHDLITNGNAAPIESPEYIRPQPTTPAPRPTPAQIDAVRHVTGGDAMIITQESGRGIVAAHTGQEWVVIRAQGESASASPALAQRLPQILAEGGATMISMADYPERPVEERLAEARVATTTPTVAQETPPVQQQATTAATEAVRAGTKSARQQLKDIGADFLDKVKPGPDGSLIEARVSKAKANIEQADPIPYTWDEINLTHRSEILEQWRDDQRKELRADPEINARWKADADREAQQVVDSLSQSQIAGEVHKRITQTPGFENASVSDVATLLKTGEATAIELAGQYKSEVKSEEVDNRLDGRRSWLRNRMKQELQARQEATSLEDLHLYAKMNGQLDRYKNKRVTQILSDFGITLQDATSMIGAPDDVEFSVSASYDGGINLYSEGKIRMNRTIERDSQGRLVVHNNSFFIDDDMPKGTGLQILANAVGYAKKMGVHKFYTNPCRSEGYTRSDGTKVSGMVGYAVWPQFGYDAPLSEIRGSDLRAKVRAEFPNAQSIRDVYDTPGGQAWWWKNGDSIGNAEFYLQDGSRNLKAMQDYMASKKAARERVKAAAKARRSSRTS